MRSGRTNPNCKHKELEDSFFSEITSEEQAYILGLIASDGSIHKNTINLALDKKDKALLDKIGEILHLPVNKKGKSRLYNIAINSKKIVEDVCQHLHIHPGAKAFSVGFPSLNNEHLQWCFIRGFFDGDGSIRKIERQNIDCKITTNSIAFKQGLARFLNKEIVLEKPDVCWYGSEALDFLGRLYDKATLYLPRKRDLYLDWCTFVPGLSGTGNHGKELLFSWNRARPDAVRPNKTNVSDSGFDLVLLEKVKQIGMVELYDTGIKIEPAYGWYFDLVPRSSIIKTGYMMAHSLGVIDRAYRGTILVPLIKVNPESPTLELPARLVQIVPRPIIHVVFEETEDLNKTARDTGGFGSTGRT